MIVTNKVMRRSGMPKRIFSILLALSLTLSVMPAMAAEIPEPSESEGGQDEIVCAANDTVLDLDNQSMSYTIQCVDGGTLSTQSEGKPKMLVFFTTTCWNCKSTLSGISRSEWAKSAQVDVYALELNNSSREAVINFRDEYCPEGGIQFGYGSNINMILWRYLGMNGISGRITTPAIIMIDANNRIKFMTTGLMTATEISKTYLPVLIPGYAPPVEPVRTPVPTQTPVPTASPVPTQAPQPTSTPGGQETQFTDVRPGSWMESGIKFVNQRGLMVGLNASQFAPNQNLDRSMFAAVLYRLAGSPQVTFKNTFKDVPAGQWYSDAIIWAYENDIVRGLGDGYYGPKENITREQMARMLMQFGKNQGYNVSQSTDLNAFADQAAVSAWAGENVRWAVGAGIISGTRVDNKAYLNPKGNATRAECAVMLTKFIQKYQ